MSEKDPARLGQRCVAALLAIWCSLGVSIDLAGAPYEEVRALFGDVHGAAYIAAEVLCSLPARDESILVLLVAILLYRPFLALSGGLRRAAAGGAAAWLVGALFAAALLFGRSFDEAGTAAYVTGGISEAVRSTMFFTSWLLLARGGVCLLFSWVDGVLGRGRDGCFFDRAFDGVGACTRHLSPLIARGCALFDRHPFAGPAVVLTIAWLPVLIGYAPALFMWDTDTQILQWFGLPNHISSSVHLIDPDVLLTQHHPPLHTAIVGLCVQAGLALAGSENVGIFLYALVQWTVDIGALAWAIRMAGLMGSPRCMRFTVLAYLVAVPVFSNYSVLVTKDVLFAASLLVFVMELAFVIRAGVSTGRGGARCGADRHRVRPVGSGVWAAGGGSADPVLDIAVPARHAVILAVSALATALLRNGAIAVVAVACAAALAIVLRSPAARRAVLAAFGLAAGVMLALACVVYPALSIAPASEREMLSIPAQQVARFMRDHPARVSRDEFDVVDAVFDASGLAAIYEPGRSDPVKATFRETASEDDLHRFWELWERWLVEDPGCFAEATAANYYGYFYAGHAMSWSYTSYSSGVAMANTVTDWFKSGIARYFSFEPADNPVSRALDAACSGYRLLFQRLPPLTLTMQAALYDWVLVAVSAYAVSRHRSDLAPLLIAAWAVLAISLVGPCNATTYFRYVYPVALIVPFVCAMLFAGLDRTDGSDYRASLRRARDRVALVRSR